MIQLVNFVAVRSLIGNFNFVQVLNDTSLWWFNQTQHIAPNAIIAVPDKNVTIAKKCSVFPVEFVGKCLLISVLETIS